VSIRSRPYAKGIPTIKSFVPCASNMNRVLREVIARFKGGKTPTLAVAIEDGRRFSVYTSLPCHPRGIKSSHHAEERACLRKNKRIKVLLVIRFNGNGALANASPCKGCCRLVREKCKRVYCSNQQGKIVPADLNSQYITSGTRRRQKR